MLTIKNALKKMNQDYALPVRYHTLYKWVRRGVVIDNENPLTIAAQVGSIWFVDEDKLKEIADAIKATKRVRVVPDPKKKAPAKRGRKPGVKVGKYQKRKEEHAKRNKVAANRVLPAQPRSK